jgi:hypothetical protein
LGRVSSRCTLGAFLKAKSGGATEGVMSSKPRQGGRWGRERWLKANIGGVPASESGGAQEVSCALDNQKARSGAVERLHCHSQPSQPGWEGGRVTGQPEIMQVAWGCITMSKSTGRCLHCYSQHTSIITSPLCCCRCLFYTPPHNHCLPVASLVDVYVQHVVGHGR